MKIEAKKITLKNSQEIELRSVLPTDAENMLNHLKVAHAESYRNLSRPGSYWEKVSIEEEAGILTHIENTDNKFMMGAFFEGKIVGGLGLFGEQADFARHSAMVGMSIRKEFSNVGLGREMMVHAMESARRIGIHRLYLMVRTYNLHAIALYEKVGFERVGLLKDAALVDNQYVDEFYYQIIL